jgi:Holliday junction resolvase
VTINSRRKGVAGELELAAYLRGFGHIATRGQQHKGSADSPDVICPTLANVHLECKRVEAGNLYTWLDQAQRDSAGSGKIPVVAHRKNRKDWVAILPLSDLLLLLEECRGGGNLHWVDDETTEEQPNDDDTDD